MKAFIAAILSWFNKLLVRMAPDNLGSHITSQQCFQDKVDDLGKFEYTEVAIIYNQGEIVIPWNDIEAIIVWKADRLAFDEVCMRIGFQDKFMVVVESTAGWYQLVERQKERFPEIPNDWDVEIIQPPFAENHRTIYSKP